MPFSAADVQRRGNATYHLSHGGKNALVSRRGAAERQCDLQTDVQR